MKLKKVMAIALVATMTCATSLTALASEDTNVITEGTGEGNTEGTGRLEGSVSTDVYKVVLPTVVENDTTFNFILDPENLIANTGAAAYDGATFETGSNLFFKHSDGTYTNKSDLYTIKNVGRTDVKVEVKATVTGTGLENLSYATLSTFDEDDTDPMVYLALEDTNSGKNVFTTNGATLSATIEGLDASKFSYSYDSTKGYSYALTDGVTDHNDYSFYMTGACNGYADWSGFTESEAKVSVVWTVCDASKPYANPSAMSSTVRSTTIMNLPDDAVLESVVAVDASGVKVSTFAYGTQYTFDDENDEFAISDSVRVYIDPANVEKYVLTFSSATKGNKTVEIKVVAPGAV